MPSAPQHQLSIFAFAPPAVSELGNASGFDLQLQDRANLGHVALMQARNQLLGMAMKEPGLVAIRPNGMDDTPEFRLEIDEHKAGTLGIALSDRYWVAGGLRACKTRASGRTGRRGTRLPGSRTTIPSRQMNSIDRRDVQAQEPRSSAKVP